MKIRYAIMAAAALCTAQTAAAQVPDSWWSIPLTTEMHQATSRPIQTKLKELGCYDGPIDGIIGKGSERAIKTWQRRNGVPETGIISEPLMQTILNQPSTGCR